MSSVRLKLFLLFVLTAHVLGFEKFRIYSFNKTEPLPTRFLLRCPLAWSENDLISFFVEKGNNFVQFSVTDYGSDHAMLDLTQDETIKTLQCRVTHVSDNSEEKATFYFDREGQNKDIKKLKYSETDTKIVDANLGDSINLKCSSVISDGTYFWFNPDLLQINNSNNDLPLQSIKVSDLGAYFCGQKSDLQNSVLQVKKIVVKLPSTTYSILNRKNVQSTNLPMNPLGESLLYSSNRGHRITRRVVWEYPVGTVLLNQGRIFYKDIFNPDLTKYEFFNQITDRNNSKFQHSNKVLFHSLEMGKTIFTVEIKPMTETAYIDSSVELTCKNTFNYKSYWSFQRAKSDELENLPADVIVNQYDQNSTLKINSVQPIHSGTYFCDAQRDIAKATLSVVVKPNLLISPSEIIVRPGSTARFLCFLIGKKGTVIWRRKDKKSFQIDVETRIGGDTQAMLVVNQVSKDMNGSVYECSHNELVQEALLIVKDICPPSHRSCKNGQCVEEKLFCNGIQDCFDNSDEDINTCAQCEPNQFACQTYKGMKPNQRCVANHWKCDGDNDCGNGYDELNCQMIDRDSCLGTHFVCHDNQTLIPRSTWCDESINCPNGEDEKDCRDPDVVYPIQETTYVVHANNSISLVCEVVGVPTATINWRFNWGKLPNQLNYTITQTGKDCNRITNTLTIHNMHSDSAGVYTCEAVSTKRAMAKDYTLFVTSEILCQRPYFNNAAMFITMCLKCSCSGITDDCTSAMGYYQSPTPKQSRRSKGLLMNFKSKKILETSYSKLMYNRTSQSYKFEDKVFKNFVLDPSIFLAGAFGLSGSWIESYGFFMTIHLKITGDVGEEIPGPKLMIKNTNGRSLYWCPAENNHIIYTTPDGFLNRIKVSLWERENWFTDINCEKSAKRDDFINILSNVQYLLIRIKYYTAQTGFELLNITVEHAIPASSSEQNNIYVPRIEQCNCPKPYTGLSCEKCITGYKKNSENKCVRSCPENCAECDEHGVCQICKGFRSGPKCLECKPGFIRHTMNNLDTDCVECSCHSLLNNTLVVNECLRDLTDSDSHVCKCTGKEVNDISCDRCLQKPLSVNDDLACKKRNLSENINCNSIGTEIIINQQCKCKPTYTGPTCLECESGYFSHENRCVKCYCSNKATECHASLDYRFENLNLASKPVTVNVMIANRFLSGLYESEDSSKYLTTNVSDNTILFKQNPYGRGLAYITVKLTDTENPDNINTYSMLYGGKIQFKFLYFTDKLKNLMFHDVVPFIEIESKKFGRLWTAMTYDETSNNMQALFSENNILGWKIGKEELIVRDRETFIRALMTAQHIAIGFPFDNEFAQKVSIRDFVIERAKSKMASGRSAPVEQCTCPKDAPGIRCETCNKPGFQSVISVTPNTPDIICGECISEDCMICKSGSYKYDFVLNKNYSSCQQGIEITTKGRVISVNKDENVMIPCIAKSYRGGIAIHKWIKLSNSIKLNTTHEMMADKSSNLNLHFPKIQLSDSGLYVCEALNSVSNSSEEFYILVEEKTSRLSVDILVSTIDQEKSQVNVTINTPKPTDFKVDWFVVQGGDKDKKETTSKITVSTENSVYKIDIEVPLNTTGDVQLKGVISGTKVTNPFYFVVIQDIKRNKTIHEFSLSVDKKVLELNFLESGKVSVLLTPNIRTETFWFKVNEKGIDEPLPKGMGKDKNNLLVWSAADNHNGKYVGYVMNLENGTRVGKVETEVKVAPMQPDLNKDIFNVSETKNTSLNIYVPEPVKCPKQSWEVIGPNSEPKDITRFVKRISEKEIFINYQLSVGQTLRFRCSVISEIDVQGKIKIKIDSKFPVIQITEKFENMIYPISLECLDTNTAYPSTVTWYRGDSPVDQAMIVKTKNMSSTINWKLVDGFSASLHEGLYTCKVNNSFNSASKSIYLPDMNMTQSRQSKIPGSIKLSSSTNKILKVNGSLVVYVMKDRKFEITAELIGNPAPGSQLEWKVNDKVIEPTKRSKYFAKLEFPKITQEDQLGIYEIHVTLENGTQIKKSIEIAFQKVSSTYAKVSGLNQAGNLSILEGDNHSVRCMLMKSEQGSEKEIFDTTKAVWKYKNINGQEKTLSDLQDFLNEDSLKELRVFNANRKLNAYLGQCVVTFKDVQYESPFFAFDINKRDIDPKVRLVGLSENKYILNEEGSTSQLICQAYDDRSNRLLPGVQYHWEMIYNRENRLINWQKLIENGNTITFGGLVYQPLQNSSTGFCRINYFDTVMTSDIFTFKILKKDLAGQPNVVVTVKYDPAKPPYPVSVSCVDSKINSESILTFDVSNPKFNKSLIVSDSRELLINFTTNNQEFNPYTDAGKYRCNATSKSGTASKTVLLPIHQNPNSNYTAKVVIYSTPVLAVNGKIRVRDNTDIKLLCIYYGHPYVLSLKWTPEDTYSTVESSDYWTSQTFKNFNRKKSSGTYSCKGQSPQGILTETVTVEGYDFGLEIDFYTEERKPLPDNFKVKQGENITIYYSAKDLYSNKPFTESIGIWEYRHSNADNFTKMNSTYSKEKIHIIGNKIRILNVSTAKPIEIRLRVENGTTDFVSKSIFIDVLENEKLHPEITLKTTYENHSLAYPTKLICVDSNSEQSKVKITKLHGNTNNQVDSYMKSNENVLEWKSIQFSPFKDLGIYICNSTNRYKTRTITISLPEQTDRKTADHLSFESSTHKIEMKGDTKYLQLNDNEKLMVLCNYYGSKPPISDVEIAYKKKSGELHHFEKFSSNYITNQYYSHFSIENFNTDKYSGTYTCRSRNATDSLTDVLEIQGIFSGIRVVVSGLDDDNNLKLVLGSVKSLKCRGFIGDVEDEKVQYKWLVETKSGLMLNIDDLSESVLREKGSIKLVDIKKSENIRGRCEISTPDKKYYSPSFEISTVEDEDKKPKIMINQTIDEKSGFLRKVTCYDLREETSNITMLFLSGSLSDVKVRKINNLMEFEFPADSVNPIKYVGSYHCFASSKYGFDQKLVHVIYKPKGKPLQVDIASKHIDFALVAGTKYGRIRVGETSEIDCVYSGENHPIEAKWFLMKDSIPTELVKDKLIENFSVYQKRSNVLTVRIENIKKKSTISLKCSAKDSNQTIVTENTSITFYMSGIMTYVTGLDINLNFHPKQGSRDRKLLCKLIDTSSDIDVSNDYTFKWYFLRKNNEEYPTSELATEVMINRGEISFLGMKNPLQDLTAECFATNGTHNYTSSRFIVNVEEPIDKPVSIKIQVTGLDRDLNFRPKQGSSDSKLTATLIDTSNNMDVSKDYTFKWYFLKKNNEEYPINDLAKEVKIDKGQISFIGVKTPSETLTVHCFATNGIHNFTSSSIPVIVVPEMEKPGMMMIEISGLNGDLKFRPKEGSSDRKLTAKLIDTNKNMDVSKDYTFKWYFLKKNNEEHPLIELATEVKVDKGEISFIGMKKQSEPLTVHCFATNGKQNYTSPSIPVMVESGVDKPGKVMFVVSGLDGDRMFRPKEGSNDRKLIAKLIDTEKNIDVSKDYKFKWYFLKKNNEEYPINDLATEVKVDKGEISFIGMKNPSEPLTVYGFATNGINNYTSSSIPVIVDSEVDKPKMIMLQVSGLDGDLMFRPKERSSDSKLTAKLIDSSNKMDVSKDYKFKWYFLKNNNEEYPINDLATEVKLDKGEISFVGMKVPSETVTAHCFATNGKQNYTSMAIPVIVGSEGDKPSMIMLRVSGLDGDLKFRPNEGSSDRKLIVKLIETSTNKDVSNDYTFKWYFLKTNNEEYPINDLANEVKVDKGEISFVGMKKPSEPLTAHCFATNGKQNYTSMAIPVIVGSEVSFEELSLTLNSTVNKIEKDALGIKRFAVRLNRKIQLDCYVTGEPNIDVKWFMITKEYALDVPVPSQKVQLFENDNGDYKMKKISNKHFQISRDRFSLDNVDHFQCEATIRNRTISKLVKMYYSQDLFNVKITTNQTAGRNVFIEKPFKLKCEMSDMNKEIVKIKSIKWILKNKDNDEIPLKEIATNVTEANNELILEGLNMKHGKFINIQCLAFFNETYDVQSNEFKMKLEEFPKIYSVRITRSLANLKEELLPNLNYTYDARNMTQFQCKAEISAESTSRISWIKCSNSSCSELIEVSQTNMLVFNPDSTTYEDVGEYICLVKLEKNSKVLANKNVSLFIDRIAPPKVSDISNKTIPVDNNLRLYCSYVHSTPEGNVTWSFIPHGKSEPESIPKSAIVTKLLRRSSQLMIPRPLSLDHSGIYICNVTNSYGTGLKKFAVTVLPKSKIMYLL